MTSQGLLQGRQDIAALFPQGGKVTPNAAKDSSTICRSEATRDLLLDFDHTQVTFSLVI